MESKEREVQEEEGERKKRKNMRRREHLFSHTDTHIW